MITLETWAFQFLVILNMSATFVWRSLITHGHWEVTKMSIKKREWREKEWIFKQRPISSMFHLYSLIKNNAVIYPYNSLSHQLRLLSLCSYYYFCKFIYQSSLYITIRTKLISYMLLSTLPNYSSTITVLTCYLRILKERGTIISLTIVHWCI